MMPGAGFACGLVGSKYDQPRVWQRAQLFMKRMSPSVADCVVCCQSSATCGVLLLLLHELAVLDLGMASSGSVGERGLRACELGPASATHLSPRRARDLGASRQRTRRGRQLCASLTAAACALSGVVSRLST